MSKPGDITYTAIVDGNELIIREARYAGIDGPIFSTGFSSEGRPNLEQADQILTGQGFTRGDRPWDLVRTYDGLILECKLDRV